MSSRLFWFYIVNSSKPYGSGYYSLSRNYIKNFGIYNFSDEQIEHLIELSDKNEIDNYLENLYGIDLNPSKRNVQSQPYTLPGRTSQTQPKPVKEYV